MSAPIWIPKRRNYEKEKSKIAVSLESVANHPLLQNRPKAIVNNVVVNEKTKSTSGKSIALDDPLADPLSAFANSPPPPAPIDDPLSFSDPLSAFAAAPKAIETKVQVLQNVQQAVQNLSEENVKNPWLLRKQLIRKEYSITGNITLNSSAINEILGSGVEDGQSTRKVDKYDKRLGHLEKRELNKEEKIEISQKEYENHVEKLSNDLNRAWANDERVGSLKLAIQLSKLLGDTNVPTFYPSMFVVVTDVLTRFGDMVYTRLANKAEEALNAENNNSKKRIKLSTDFTSQDVPLVARDTCKNWFYKASSIRDLLPRIYVEIALLPCYRFITDTDYPMIINRIGTMIRGLGDPLVAFYCRMYLVITSNEISVQYSTYLLSLFQDCLMTFGMFDPKMEGGFGNLEQRYGITTKGYYYLLSPVIEWILKYIAYHTTTTRHFQKDIFQSILQLYRDYSNDSLVLRHIIESFDASYYAHGALGMITLIKSCQYSCFTQADLFISFGKQLTIFPPSEDTKLLILNDVWKIVMKITDFVAYLKCAGVWLDVVQRHYSDREINVILGNISSRLTTWSSDLMAMNQNYDAVQEQLELLLTSLIGQSSTFGTSILTSDHILKILDIFKGNKKVQMCKDILESFIKTQKTTNDPVLINTLFDLARVIHDSVDGLSATSDIQYNSTLIATFIDHIDFGKNFEQQLTFYVECRASFYNLSYIIKKLIHNVLYLTMKTYQLMKGKHNKKTSNFIKACLAYCHITIPSLQDPMIKLDLLYFSAQMALLNQCLPQCDHFLKAMINMIPDFATYTNTNTPLLSSDNNLPISLDEKMTEIILKLLSFLLVLPGHPEHGPFYILQGLLNSLPKFPWSNANNSSNNNSGANMYLIKIYEHMILLLTAYAQENFCYHLMNIQSNDELYSILTSKDYQQELFELLTSIMNQIMMEMTKLQAETSNNTNKSTTIQLQQSKIALNVVNILIETMEIKPELLEFMFKLIELSSRQKQLFTRQDSRYFVVTIEYLIAQLKQQYDLHPNQNYLFIASNKFADFIKIMK